MNYIVKNCPALSEAKRLAEYKIDAGTDIEILQVVKKLKGEVIPF